jgi:hypothetical protein
MVVNLFFFSVEGLKQRMAPTIHSLDSMACDGIDKINDKVQIEANRYPIHSYIPTLRWGVHFKPASADADMHNQLLLIWDFFLNLYILYQPMETEHWTVVPLVSLCSTCQREKV